LISDVYVEIGGVAVTNLTQYNQIFNVFRDFQLNDRLSYRKVLQNEYPPDHFDDLPPGMQTDNPVACWNWLGFLGTKVLDTTILPPVRIYIRLAHQSACATQGAPTATNYKLKNVSFTLDVMDIADGVYNAMIAQRLRDKPIEIPYDNYQVVLGSQGANSVRFSTSAHCLQGIMAWYTVEGWPHMPYYRKVLGLGDHFRRASAFAQDSCFRINGVPYPSIPAKLADGEVFIDTSHALNMSQDTLGSTNRGMYSLDNFHDFFFVHAHSFCYDADGEDTRLSGLDARGNQLIGSWDVTGSVAGSRTPFVVLRLKSILRIGQGKLIEQIL
jgi:hypothetical protein